MILSFFATETWENKKWIVPGSSMKEKYARQNEKKKSGSHTPKAGEIIPLAQMLLMAVRKR